MALFRSVATVGGYTMASRLLGFVRDVLIAAVLGAGPIADAFFVALQLPNLFRRLFAEGAFNAGFVPLFSDQLTRHGRRTAFSFAEQAMSVLITVLVPFVLLAQVAAPVLIYVLAPGFLDEPLRYGLAVDFARYTFPYLLFISLVSLLGGVLNSLNRFAAAAATPILFNLTLIAAVLVVAPHTPTPGHALAFGVTISGMLQFLWLVLVARRQGFELRLPLPRLTPPVRAFLTLALPAALGAGAGQINILMNMLLASFLPPGSVSYLFYADRLMELPVGVVGIALGTALLPVLSQRIAAGDEAAAQAVQNRALELGLLLSLPAAAALIAIPHTIVSVLFQRGAFGPAETAATAQALVGYAIGLPAFVLLRVLATGFYARQDTRTPVRIALVSLAVNLVLNLVLMWPFRHVGLALALSLSVWLQVVLQAVTLHRRRLWRADARLRRSLPLVALATLAMALSLIGIGWLLQPMFGRELAFRAGALALLVLGGLAVYALAAHVAGAARFGDILRQLRRPA